MLLAIDRCSMTTSQIHFYNGDEIIMIGIMIIIMIIVIIIIFIIMIIIIIIDIVIITNMIIIINIIIINMIMMCFLPPCAPSASWQISPHAAPLPGKREYHRNLWEEKIFSQYSEDNIIAIIPNIFWKKSSQLSEENIIAMIANIFQKTKIFSQ